MANGEPPREELWVPDRFEGLREAEEGDLRTFVVPIESALDEIDRRFADMRAARRGSLMILRGNTGAGKSTFLETIGLFRAEVRTERIASSEDVRVSLESVRPTDQPRVIVLEGREALQRVSKKAIEESLHAVNSFVRSEDGQDTLVVWPTNTDDLTEILVEKASVLGGEALFGVADPVTTFTGPPHEEYVGIAEKTVAALNQGASLAALGISEARATDLAKEAETIGRYLALVRRELLENTNQLRRLMVNEQYRVWTVVIAGNDPEGDVAALTRGGFAVADIDRLMTSTGANIVSELQKQPDAVGILGTVLDAKILHIDMLTILAAAREFGEGRLHELMDEIGMSTAADKTAPDRLRSSELGLILAGDSLGTKKRGSKPGGGTRDAFDSLASIARDNDAVLNRALANGLHTIGLIDDFEVEEPLGTDLRYVSDLLIVRDGRPTRLEVMWRASTSRAAIANYVLRKLGNYGKAIGALK